MSPSPGNYVAIDTNVFGQISGKDEEGNRDEHVYLLLTCLKLKNYSLLVDNKKIIWKEYHHHLLNEEWLKKYEWKDEGLLLKYWIGDHAPVKEVEIDCDDNLAREIRKVIPEVNERTDRVLVYVASIETSPLISNDEKHIVSRKSSLLALCPHASDIMTSEEAFLYCKQP